MNDTWDDAAEKLADSTTKDDLARQVLKARAERNTLLLPVLAWLARGESGISSETMAFRAVGLERGGTFGEDHPHDPGDFRRCVSLLDAVPELRNQMHTFAEVSPEWAGLVKNWRAIEEQLEAEMAAGNRAPLTWKMMKEAMEC